MSRARAIYLVARREILERGRSRAFLISLVLTVVFLVAGIFLPKLLGGEDQAHKLGVVGTPPAGFEQALTATAGQAQLKVNVESVPDVATGEARLNEGTLDGMLVVPRRVGRLRGVRRQEARQQLVRPGRGIGVVGRVGEPGPDRRRDRSGDGRRRVARRRRCASSSHPTRTATPRSSSPTSA